MAGLEHPVEEAMQPPEDEESDASASAQHLLGDGPLDSVERQQGAAGVLARLYISHTLSAWNSRTFEFGAVLFLAAIFRDTLLYASVYALARALSIATLSSWLGTVVDRTDRLVTVRQSIVWQRIPVAASCACFIAMLAAADRSQTTVFVLFAVVVVLAWVEKLAASANTVAVERDWAIVISESLDVRRQDLNASMRRIDLACKLFAPVAISLIDALSTRHAVWVVFGLNATSVVVEYAAIAQVYKRVPALSRRQPLPPQDTESDSGANADTASGLMQSLNAVASPWREYVTSPVFLPSFALSCLYLTVLSFGAQMVTYLLHTGFSALQVSAMRIGAVVAELSGTWAAPVVMNRIGCVRSGLWFLNWQFVSLAAAAAGFVFLDASSQLVATSLVVGVAWSRIGLWGFDLCVQFLVQENIAEDKRARFSATEMALQSIFELLSFTSTIVFPLPAQFKYPVLISYGAVAVAAVSFAVYVRKERGHLLHASKCFGGGDKARASGYSRIGTT